MKMPIGAGRVVARSYIAFALGLLGLNCLRHFIHDVRRRERDFILLEFTPEAWQPLMLLCLLSVTLSRAYKWN